MKKTLSTLVILLVVAGLAFGAYKYFIAKPAAPAGTDGGLSTTAGVATDPVTTATPDADVSSAANEFLTLLLSVQSIKLDDTLFANPSFSRTFRARSLPTRTLAVRIRSLLSAQTARAQFPLRLPPATLLPSARPPAH